MSVESLLVLESLLIQDFDLVLTCPYQQSCISEAQKYQGKLYKEPKKKGAAAATTPNSKPAPASQALVQSKPPMDSTLAEADNRVALVDAPPRAPSPPPGINVFDFMISNGDGNSTHPLESPPSSPSSSEVSSSSEEEADSDSDSMDTDDNDPVVDAAEAAREYMKAELLKQGYMFGNDPQFQSFAQFPPSPAGQSGQFETPAPKASHRRNISTTSVEDSTAKETTKKRKRGSPEQLDLSSARAYRANGDVVMTDVAPPLHSGLTGGLNRLLSRPELPPSPPDVDSPQSPLKRSKQAKLEDKKTKEKDKRRTEKLAEREAKKKSKSKEEKKDKKDKKAAASSAPAGMDLKNGRWVRTRSRKDSSMQEQVSEPDQPPKRAMKAIEYHPTDGSDDKLKATPNNAMVLHSKKSVARAEVFLSAAAKDLETDRGCSLNKALKRYYRDHASRKNAKDEKDLFKVLRFRKNDRGELVLFIDGPE
jgi:cell growth-regulating nucleolar protein